MKPGTGGIPGGSSVSFGGAAGMGSIPLLAAASVTGTGIIASHATQPSAVMSASPVIHAFHSHLPRGINLEISVSNLKI